MLSKVYFNINSDYKRVLTKKGNKKYIVKTNSRMVSFIKKELNKFFNTPVFMINAGFGLILYIFISIAVCIKFNDISSVITTGESSINIDLLNNYIPAFIFLLLCFGTFMTSITSSMISLEGKKFSLIKSLPIKPFDISLYKVLSSLIVMIPFLIIGDIILFVNFKINIISIILLLSSTIILSYLSEIIGIIINLKFPKTDFINDTEVVKQSMSSFFATIIGMSLVAISVMASLWFMGKGLSSNIIILIFNFIYLIISILLTLLLNKISDSCFNNISI